jgi:hypothetical protein
MNKVTPLFAIVSIVLISASSLTIISTGVIQDTFGINGTCGGNNITEGVNQTLISNLTIHEYFKNLTADNPQLAEIVKAC